jgi:hypothetical protein
VPTALITQEAEEESKSINLSKRDILREEAKKKEKRPI